MIGVSTAMSEFEFVFLWLVDPRYVGDPGKGWIQHRMDTKP